MSNIGNTDAFSTLGRVNLNHLLYFWAVGQTGSVTAAAKRLGISQPSVSEQVRTLEARLGTTLFERGPRGVSLTPQGQSAMRFAEEIVGVCHELVRSIPLDIRRKEQPLVVGLADAVPKLVVRSILAPLLAGDTPPRFVCREWRIDHLLAELSLFRMDMVISDAPVAQAEGSALRSYVATSSPVSLYAAPSLTRRLRGGFPGSLQGAPMLLPTDGTALRGSMDRWLALHRIRPKIVVEAEDRALLHNFAEAAYGVVAIAAVTAKDVARQFSLTHLGDMKNVQEQYFLVTIERTHEHPGVRQLRSIMAAREVPRKRRGEAVVKPAGIPALDDDQRATP